MTAIVVMGPSGSGKTTLGLALAEALGSPYIDGDALHPPKNIEKMRSGDALDDMDRAPFLDRVADAIAEAPAVGVVLSCSALKRRYRDHIRANARRPVTFVLPMASREVLRGRLGERAGHFMPALLLDSQLADLELPTEEEDAILVSGELSTELQVMRVLSSVRR
jgi:gluconokinase